MIRVTYTEAILQARDLASESGENPEYDRALYELLARMFPVVDMDTETRAHDVRWDMQGNPSEILHPDGSDCDYCTYDKACITIKNTLPDSVKDLVPNNNETTEA